MRQLLLPACVCLVGFPAVTDSQPRLTLEEFTLRTMAYAAPQTTTGIAQTDTDETPRNIAADIKIDKPVDVPAEPVVVALPAEAPAAAPDAQADLGAGNIEYPVPSGVVVNDGIPTGVPLPPIAKPVVARSREEICDTLTKSAQINNLPAPFFIRLLFRESRFDPAVVSNAGAQGIAQFMPGTAADMGVENPFDPALAIPASARLLSNLVRQFGNLGLAAAAYNAGPKRVQDWLGSKGKGKLPDETQGYVKIITGHPVEKWSEAAAQHPGEKLPRRAPCQESAGLLAWNGPDTVPVPQPSPLRIAPTDKAVVVASLRADMKHADRAEREAEAKNSAKISVKTAAKVEGRAAGKASAKNVAKNASKSAIKIAKIDLIKIDTPSIIKDEKKAEPKAAAKTEPKPETKSEKKHEAKASAHTAAAVPTAKSAGKPAGKAAPTVAPKRERIAQR